MKFEIGDILKRNDLYKARFKARPLQHSELFEVMRVLGDGHLRTRCIYSEAPNRKGYIHIVQVEYVTVVEQM